MKPATGHPWLRFDIKARPRRTRSVGAPSHKPGEDTRGGPDRNVSERGYGTRLRRGFSMLDDEQ